MKPLIRLAEDQGVKIGIENCPMSFTKDEWPGGKNLFTTPVIWRRAFEDYDAARLRRALIGIVGPLPVDPTIPSTHWTISNAGDDLLAVRAAGPGRFVGQLADRARLAETLGRRLRDVHALPAGFVLDFDGRHEALGEAVGVPIELSPALPRATLRHPDVGAVLKQAALSPLKTVCQADDVAIAVMAAVTHLRLTTGSTLLVDGGRHL